MTDPNWSKDAKKPSELIALVEHIADRPDLQETEYLEWKAGYDLSTNPGAASTARQLIGFANRDPKAAARYFDGYAYILFGVEAGSLPGVATVWDATDVENWLNRFVNESLRYEIVYLDVRGKKVLLFKAAPPEQGDPIFALQKTSADEKGNTLSEGTIYVRRGSKTQPNTAQDLVRLTERATGAGTELSISVSSETTEIAQLDADILSNEARAKYLNGRREALLSGLPAPKKRDRFDMSLSISMPDDYRSEDQFKEDVDAFVSKAGGRWEEFCFYQLVRVGKSEIVLAVHNDTQENFEAVAIELTVPLPRSQVHAGVSDAAKYLEPPKEPDPWASGHIPKIDMSKFIAESSEAAPTIEDAGNNQTVVRFRPFHLYPGTRHRLPSFSAVLISGDTLEPLSATWRAVAMNTQGDTTGQIRIIKPAEAAS